MNTSHAEFPASYVQKKRDWNEDADACDFGFETKLQGLVKVGNARSKDRSAKMELTTRGSGLSALVHLRKTFHDMKDKESRHDSISRDKTRDVQSRSSVTSAQP